MEQPRVPIAEKQPHGETPSDREREAVRYEPNWKAMFMKQEKLYGTRAIAASVADMYIQAIDNGGTPQLVATCESYFSRIAQNTELSHIFHTSMQLVKEERRLLKAWLAADYASPEKEAASRAFDEQLHRIEDYRKDLTHLQDTQPFSEAPVHPLCKEALQYWVRSGTLPQEHIRKCPVCS